MVPSTLNPQPSTLNQKSDSPKSGHGGLQEQSFTQAFHYKV